MGTGCSPPKKPPYHRVGVLLRERPAGTPDRHLTQLAFSTLPTALGDKRYFNVAPLLSRTSRVTLVRAKYRRKLSESRRTHTNTHADAQFGDILVGVCWLWECIRTQSERCLLFRAIIFQNDATKSCRSLIHSLLVHEGQGALNRRLPECQGQISSGAPGTRPSPHSLWSPEACENILLSPLHLYHSQARPDSFPGGGGGAQLWQNNNLFISRFVHTKTSR